jgi:hypothetical protein
MNKPLAKQTWLARIGGEVRTVRTVTGANDISDSLVIVRVMDTDGQYVVQKVHLHTSQLIVQVPDLVT